MPTYFSYFILAAYRNNLDSVKEKAVSVWEHACNQSAERAKMAADNCIINNGIEKIQSARTKAQLAETMQDILHKISMLNYIEDVDMHLYRSQIETLLKSVEGEPDGGKVIPVSFASSRTKAA